MEPQPIASHTQPTDPPATVCPERLGLGPHSPVLWLRSLSPASSLPLLALLLLQFWWLTTHLRMLEAMVSRKSSKRTHRPRPSAHAGDWAPQPVPVTSAQVSLSFPTLTAFPPWGRCSRHCPTYPNLHPCRRESNTPRDRPRGRTHIPLLPPDHHPWAPAPPAAPNSSAIPPRRTSADSTGTFPIMEPPWTQRLLQLSVQMAWGPEHPPSTEGSSGSCRPGLGNQLAPSTPESKPMPQGRSPAHPDSSLCPQGGL